MQVRGRYVLNVFGGIFHSPSFDAESTVGLTGKTLRDGQGQASNRSDEEVLDLVITNALVIDWSGIFKVRTRVWAVSAD